MARHNRADRTAAVRSPHRDGSDASLIFQDTRHEIRRHHQTLSLRVAELPASTGAGQLLIVGDPHDDPLVHIHRRCVHGERLRADCDCVAQLDVCMDLISAAGAGILIDLEPGIDPATVDGVVDYLRTLGFCRVRLLTNDTIAARPGVTVVPVRVPDLDQRIRDYQHRAHRRSPDPRARVLGDLAVLVAIVAAPVLTVTGHRAAAQLVLLTAAGVTGIRMCASDYRIPWLAGLRLRNRSELVGASWHSQKIESDIHEVNDHGEVDGRA